MDIKKNNDNNKNKTEDIHRILKSGFCIQQSTRKKNYDNKNKTKDIHRHLCLKETKLFQNNQTTIYYVNW